MTWPSSSDRATLQLTQSSARTRSSRVKILTISSAPTVPPPASWWRTTMTVSALLTPAPARRRRAPSRGRPAGRSRIAAGTRSTAGAARHPTPPVVVVARRISAAARTMVRRAPAVSVALPWTTAVSRCPAERAREQADVLPHLVRLWSVPVGSGKQAGGKRLTRTDRPDLRSIAHSSLV